MNKARSRFPRRLLFFLPPFYYGGCRRTSKQLLPGYLLCSLSSVFPRRACFAVFFEATLSTTLRWALFYRESSPRVFSFFVLSVFPNFPSRKVCLLRISPTAEPFRSLSVFSTPSFVSPLPLALPEGSTIFCHYEELLKLIGHARWVSFVFLESVLSRDLYFKFPLFSPFN